MRRVTRFFRLAALTVAMALFPGMLLAQTPTPTPTATPTPTPTPTPEPVTSAPASVASIGIPNGGRYDASNMVLEADGTIWTASASENVLARISADEKKVKRWAMPRDAAPSHLLKESDGTFWVAQLGGFKISRFDPATAQLTEWADAAHRPTAFVKGVNGTLWLPETNGTLTNFDPATGVFVYWRSTDAEKPISSLTYPFLDADGSIWSADFLRGNLLRYAPDGATVTRWALPDAFSQPSKIIRGPDGAIWISLYSASQLARFDPVTAELKTFNVGFFVLPFDMKVYKDRIAYTEQQAGEVGVFDPRGRLPAETKQCANRNGTHGRSDNGPKDLTRQRGLKARRHTGPLTRRRRDFRPGGADGNADIPPNPSAHPAGLSRRGGIGFGNGLGGAADFSYWQWYKPANGPIAQLDRVTDFYSVGCRFESCWDRQ